MKLFVDSNFLLYVAEADHPNRRPARCHLETAGDGEYEPCTSAEVLQIILRVLPC